MRTVRMDRLRRGRTARRLVLLLVFVTALPASAQERGFQGVLSGQAHPLTRKLGELTPDWRRITVSGPYEMGGLMQSLGSFFGGPNAGTYFTRGATVEAGGETYIVAYHVPGKGLDFAALMRAGAEPPSLPEPEPLTAETPLSLALLNVRTIGSLTDIRPFDLEREIRDSRSGGGNPAATSQSNLRQIGAGLMMYAQDFDERFPPMETPAQLKEAIMPYVKSEAIFLQPGSKEPYRPSPLLSRRNLADLAAPAETVAAYEGSADAEGQRNVVFADGHVKRLNQAQWMPLAEQMAEGQRREEAGRESVRRLRRLGEAMLRHAREQRGLLPATRDPAALARALRPLVEEPGTFEQPDTRQLYRANAAISGRRLAAIRAPAQTVAFYEPKPLEDAFGNATRGVVFLSGRAKRIPEEEWQALRARLRLP